MRHDIRSTQLRWAVAFLAASALFLADASSRAAHAQFSGSSRRYAAPRRSTQPGSTRRSRRTAVPEGVALSGYCAVCIRDMKKWVPGHPDYLVEYDGSTYYFPNDEIRGTFLADPAKYAPALGGDCTVCYAKMKERIPGTVYFAAFHKQRLYLFPGEEQKQMFVENPAEFADIDLAHGGNCSVCLVEMQQEVAGSSEFAVYHKGFRYLFPGEDERKMFLENPSKYEFQPADAEETTGAATPAGDESETVSFIGKSACAGCDFALKPLGSDELGLAVETDEGRVYVIEDAHELYPEVYKSRFEGLLLQVTGTPLKTEGLTTWLTPSEVNVLTPGS